MQNIQARDLPQGINDSYDLAIVLNAKPLTPEDGAETPRDWLAGIWVAGNTYPLDPQATTKTVAVLADGTAAVKLSPQGELCGGEHRRGLDYEREHWCLADREAWTDDDARGVIRDWRVVDVWDANGYTEAEVYGTVDDAKAAYTREVAELKKGGEELRGMRA